MKDEDIISLLRGDNRRIKKMELTHPRLARVLFHLWNLVLQQTQAANENVRSWDDIKHMRHNLEAKEKAFLETRYSNLSDDQKSDLIEKLTHIHIGEMQPCYIMRYGFYEGYTGYRADPIAIALIFGLKSLEEIEAAFPGVLHQVLTEHFIKE